MKASVMAEQWTTTEEQTLFTGIEQGLGVAPKKIWIDLDNTPHVPFFAPIIHALKSRGHQIFLTARDAYQVPEMVELYHMECIRVGKHLGKNKVLKVYGVCDRALHLLPIVSREKPDLALSHGSRSQLLSSYLLGIPSMLIIDYEHAHQGLLWIYPTWVMCPDVIPSRAIKGRADHVLRYRGIKEDVYAPYFQSDTGTRSRLGLRDTDLVVTIRPPATEAHYHRPESDVLFEAVVKQLSGVPEVRMLVLPRNARQTAAVREAWPELINSGRLIIPEHAVEGMNLIWHSDLVVSGGGTMNREAAALGVPVYSIFRGEIGSVDKYLAEQGRLVLLENAEDAKNKLKLVRRNRSVAPNHRDRHALHDIVEGITSLLEKPERKKNQ
jgi:predicted glycosyltransferase